MNSSRMRSSGAILRRLGCVFLFLPVLFSAGGAAGAALDSNFDHDQTAFPLAFKHATVSCESCHVQAIFAGTPRRCSECHSNSGRIQASAPSPRHIPVIGDCEYCHQPIAWDLVTEVDHYAVVGPCQSCHNNVIAEGKNPGHVQSSDNCDNCHRTFTWTGAVFDHSNTSGRCFACHNGAVSQGKDPDHILTTNTCDDCHNTFNWIPVLRVDHAAVLGTCYSCHNGVQAEGKNPGHPVTGNDCESCHSTNAWLPATSN